MDFSSGKFANKALKGPFGRSHRADAPRSPAVVGVGFHILSFSDGGGHSYRSSGAVLGRRSWRSIYSIEGRSKHALRAAPLTAGPHVKNDSSPSLLAALGRARRH